MDEETNSDLIYLYVEAHVMLGRCCQLIAQVEYVSQQEVRASFLQKLKDILLQQVYPFQEE